ncbi:MAG: DUF6745 domain-containing protein [Janthinobacterium lividum]
MFRLNARGRQLARPTAAPAVAALTSGPAVPAARPVAPVSTVEPLRVTPDAVRKLLQAGNLPAALVVTGPVRLLNESWLRELPASLECTHLDVSGCTNLDGLPERLRATSVHAARTAVREIPGDWLVREHLDLSANPHLTSLPERLTARSLDVSACPRLLSLPANLHLTHWVELAGSGLTSLPAGLRVQLRWQGTTVDERTAFRPEELRAADLLLVRNVTHRRVLLERFGLDRFMHEVGGLVFDRDRDAGGERQLLSVPLPDDEPLHVLRVNCPSTAHVYLLRVPPHVRTCRRAAAWLAGFEHERDYRPLIET